VNVSLSGGVHSTYGAEEALMRPGMGVVFSAGQPHVLRPLSDRVETIGIKLDRDLVEGELSRMLGRPVERPIRFALGFDLVEPGGAAWNNLLGTLLTELDRPFGLLDQPRLRLHYVRTLVSGLLTAQAHDYSDELWTPGPRLRPRTVRAAIEYIESHLDTPVTLTDIAAASGCSARSLQESFRQHVGLSPMGYLRDLRLQRVNAELRAGTDGVTAVAYRWGFTHLGRFSSAYRRRFGELPSTTATRAV
jgi:AraC-like DNA-binding protein